MNKVGLLLFLGTLPAIPSLAEQDRQTPIAPAVALEISGKNVSTSGDGHEGRPVLQHRNGRYQLRSGDVLGLNFPFTSEFNQVLTIQPDGYISLRGVGDLKVAGKTTPEAVEALRAAYAQILHDPVITIELKDFEKPYFIVAGEVNKPGKFDLRGDTTTTQAVAIAGGFNENSRLSRVFLFRQVPSGWEQVRELNLKKMLKTANLGEDLYLQPGDMLFIPRNMLSKVKRFIPYPTVGLR